MYVAGIGDAAPLQHALDRIGAGGLGELHELVERRLGLLDARGAVAGTDEQRALLAPLEVDLGCGEPPALPVLVRARRTHAAPPRCAFARRSSVDVDVDVEDVHDRPTEAHVSPSVTVNVPPSTSTCTRHRRVRAGARRRRRRTRRYRTTASLPRRAPRPASRAGRRRATRDELDVRPTREARVVFEHRAVRSRPGPTPGSSTKSTKCGLPMPAASPR